MKFYLSVMSIWVGSQTFANASMVLDCTTFAPKGAAIIEIVKSAQPNKGKLRIKYKNLGLNQTFLGEFDVTFWNSGDGSETAIVAKGTFRDQNKLILAGIQGSLKPDQNGFIRLGTHASRDHRIEFGYGNPIACKVRPKIAI